jgi:di/tricarboxylate transporter
MSVWIVSIILSLTLFLLVTEKTPIDLTAIGIMVALMISRVLEPAEAVAGFANPAVITVGAMFLISQAMVRTGAVGYIAQTVVAYSRGKVRIAMVFVLLIVAIASAFINNTPVVVLFIPVILGLGCEYNLSPSKFLIPISYASILAGTCTLIGTSTNIIVSDLSFMQGYGALGMFELSVLGVPLALVGIAFVLVAAPRLMPNHTPPTCELEEREEKKYLTEVVISEGSALIGKDPNHLFEEKYPTFELFEIIRDYRIFYPERDRVTAAENDRLFLKGSANDLIAFLNEEAVELPHIKKGSDNGLNNKQSLIVELIIPPQSSFIGQRLLETGLMSDPDMMLLAMKRRSSLYTEQNIQKMKLRVGDIILVRCPYEKLERMRGGTDFIIVEDVHREIFHKKKARWAFLIFAGVIVAASTNLADIMLCALAGAFFMILTGCLQLREAYQAMQGKVLLLIVGTIALGAAMVKTGTSQIYAQAFLDLFHGSSPAMVLTGILVLTSLGTQVLSNNATAVLIVPIAISTALSLDVDPRAFIVAVCFGASACFATPIGYQTNLLVYGPGGYRFSDYLKLGIPLNLLVITMGGLLIPVFWPL